MPTQNKNEKKDDVINRCIPIVIKDGAAKDDKKKAKKKGSAMKNLNAEIHTFAAGEEATNEFDFELVGYTGKIMEQMSWKGIFDLEGMESKNGKVIVLREHERDRIVGYGKTFTDDRGFIVRGKFSNTTADGKEVRALLAEGFPLQCSVGITPKSQRIAKDDETVNGVKLAKGVEIWDSSYVGEVSVCSWGVDTDTSVLKLAKEINMEDMKKEEKVLLDCGCEDTCTCEKDDNKEVKVEVELETPVEETPAKDVELAKEDVKLFTQADLDAAVAGEQTRVASIFAADAPIELTKKAIVDGLSEGDAFKFFWTSEKGMKAESLKDMASEAPVVEDVKPADVSTSLELGYTELITETIKEKKLSIVDATKDVMKNHPEAYTKFIGR